MYWQQYCCKVSESLGHCVNALTIKLLFMIPLEELQVYKVAMEIGEIVWSIVEKWNYYQKDTLGKQFVKAADSWRSTSVKATGDFISQRIETFVFTAGDRHLRREQQWKRPTKETFYQSRKIFF